MRWQGNDLCFLCLFPLLVGLPFPYALSLVVPFVVALARLLFLLLFGLVVDT
jgi:hypothetical protein